MGWGRYVANALPAAGVGNGATSAHIPENHVEGGGSRWVGGGLGASLLREEAVGGKPGVSAHHAIII